jgi:hypothetical protein
MKKFANSCLVFAVVATTAWADEVTEWNQILFQAAVTANSSPLVATREAAIVHAAVYDAVNSIDRRFTSIRVEPAGPAGASMRAAAVQAAYASLVKLYPTQKATFDQRRVISLAAIATDSSADGSDSIAQGVDWGQTVSDAIWDWRNTDGFTPAPPPFLGGTGVGQWRPTPPAMAPGAGPQFATMTPWAIASPSQFRPAGPPALTSARYTADFNETKSMGYVSSTIRTPDQTIYSLFWNANLAGLYWNRIAVTLALERHTTIVQNARILGLLNLALADAAIACWDAKYHYVFWRPVTAIPLAASDENADTAQDMTWEPLFATPAHPEYPSGHSTVSGAGAAVLSSFFGEQTDFSVTSDLMMGVVRHFTSFSAALEEIRTARIYAGIHFRSACNDGQATGVAVARYVMATALLPLNGDREAQLPD